MKKFKRIFMIVMDSAGIGAMKDADKFGDAGTNTFVHVSERNNGLNIPNMNAMGIADLGPVKGCGKVNHPHSYVVKANEASNGKDTMTGHWEMMGVLTTNPFKTFTDTGFPQSLIKELEEKTGRKVIGNKAASGTEILKELGEKQIKDGSLIVYTSSDSVLQICGHEDYIPLKELYRYCEIAREICMKPEYLLGRIIARPYVGTCASDFKRTSNRHDYALSPTYETYMDDLKKAGYTVSCIGKINDIFNGQGVTKTQRTTSNVDGMNKTIQEADIDFEGLCFVNLVEFDSEYGHRRNPIGYAHCFEEFDEKLGELLPHLKNDDLLIITADHGNDPTHTGTDHTREQVPVLMYSPSFTKGRKLDDLNTFADMGRTIIDNFGLKPEGKQTGDVINEIFE